MQQNQNATTFYFHFTFPRKIKMEQEQELFRQALKYQVNACFRKIFVVSILLSWIGFVVSLLFLACGVNTNKNVMVPIICISGATASFSTVYCLCSCLREE